MHGHGYTRSRFWPNSRLSGCKKYKQEYRILFPFEEEDDLQGLGVELNRNKGRWRTIGRGFQDADDELLEEAKNRGYTLEEDLHIHVANMKFEETTQGDRFFFSYTVSNELRSLQDLLQATSNPERLIHLKDERGNNALALACIEGHLDVVELLVEKGADIKNINLEGKTPLMESLCFGRGSLSEFLVLRGASTSAKDAEGTSSLEIAKHRLGQMEEYEWMLSRMEHETYEHYLERKENRDCFSRIVDLCTARNKSRRKTRGGLPSHKDRHQGVAFAKIAAGPNTQITVMLAKFTAPMANECKTFGFLDRGSPYDDIFAVSGYTGGEFGGIDGCLNREVWIEKVFTFCTILGHKLVYDARKDGNRLGNYHACHAEKQLMAYFIWKHTTLQEELNEDEVNEDEDDGDSNNEAMWTKYEAIKELSSSSPREISAHPTIYIHNERGIVCSDCQRFQKLVRYKTGINFEIKVVLKK